MKRALFSLMLLGTPLAAHDRMAGDLHIIHPSIPAPAASAQSAAGYVTISNDGDTPEELIGVRTPFAASTTLHSTIFEDGIARMHPLAGLTIAPGEVINLEPGGDHVMFMGLTSPAVEGDMIPATLIFRNAGEVAVEFMVDPANGADHSTDHSGH
ncbi:copper chaperone PCu(A)C [Antarcticimicrobium luteum]|uniref:Copper chaperone PCu(A)C n=1 Tax=Antarcticimicrobium luteum TaxID=2547397 RepID=A0A4R5UTA0_9RHOB|nr:copper chaperone PCu(A)C [Antarcticimicrobium luteum]TDK42378.1 copper chaperone PCu(A)C [Antarcticimicrobium luteum]